MVNVARLIKLFSDLVSIDSPSYKERNICDFVKSKLDYLRIKYCEDDAAEKIGGNCGNLYCYIEGSKELDPILFSVHLDTVEPSHHKEVLIKDDGTICSKYDTVLGADDLAGVSALLEALNVIRDNNIPHRPVEIIFSVAEEVYCQGINAFNTERIKSKDCYVLDLTDDIGAFAYKAPTILSFEIIFKGRAAHSGFEPEKGIHAIKMAAEAICRINCGKENGLSVNIGLLNAGTASNIVPDYCKLSGEIRGFDDAAVELKALEIETICQEAAHKYNSSIIFNTKKHCKAYATELESKVVQRYKSVLNKMNIEMKARESFGGSDNNYLSNQGLDGIVLASAMHNCHSADEYTSIDELKLLSDIVINLICSDI